jgi:hypothetical protein
LFSIVLIYVITPSNAKIKFPDKSTAQIVANSLSVDEEFSELVERQITVDENCYVHV